jgi:hypothetical protein
VSEFHLAPRALTYSNVVAELRRRFPPLQNRIDEVSDDGPHVVFGWAVNPLLAAALDRGETTDPLPGPLFAFIEEMAASDDWYVCNVVKVTICESLGDDPVRMRRARELIGPKTSILSLEIEHYLGREWPGGAAPDA